jgi:tripartite-type tricarboxylate transporter receptor subunit TctC
VFKSGKLSSWLRVTQALLAALSLLCGATANADSKFPSGPITLVVGFPPGGSNDLVARVYAPKLSSILGVPVVVSNRPGANGVIGTAYVARAKPDGYTITLGSVTPLTISRYTYANLPFDSLTDLLPLTTVAASPGVIASSSSLPVKNLAELVALSNTRQVTVASSGVGGLAHLTIEQLRLKTKGNFLHVPYKGGDPALTDVLGGRTDAVIVDYAVVSQLIKAGKMRGLAASRPIGNIEGSPLISTNWFAVEVPAKTPKLIAEILRDALVKASNDPGVKSALAQLYMYPLTQGSLDEAEAFQKSESVRWGKVAEAAGIKPQ